MHFSTATVAALLAAAVGTNANHTGGFLVPQDLPDGVYKTFVHENGTEEHTRLADPMGAVELEAFLGRRDDVSPVSPLLPRDFQWYKHTVCYGSEKDKHNIQPSRQDIEGAIQGLRGQIGSSADIDAGVNVWTKVGCAIAYVCVTAPMNKRYRAHVDEAQRREAFSSMNGKCGHRFYGGFGKACKPYRRGNNDLACWGLENYCSNIGQRFCNTIPGTPGVPPPGPFPGPGM